MLDCRSVLNGMILQARGTFSNGNPFLVSQWNTNGSTPAKDGGCHLSSQWDAARKEVKKTHGGPSLAWKKNHVTCTLEVNHRLKNGASFLDDDKSLQNY